MYNNNQIALLWLNSIDRISVPKKHKILSIVKSPFDLWSNLNSYESVIINNFDKITFDLLKIANDKSWLYKLLKELEDLKITFITYLDDEYPSLLSEIPVPPIVLYCKGDVSLLSNKCFAIVGSRTPSRYGRETTEKFAEALAISGFCIVSGLARGIDAIAHNSALKVKKNTIAVLGNGIDYIYPVENTHIYNEIAEHGLIITEYPPKTRPLQHHFPERNRIIAGISESILVTEAGLNSGSMITVDDAIEYNRNIYIVPGNINSKLSMGCNQKLKDLQGAMVTDPSDILKDYNLPELIGDNAEPIQLDVVEELIVNALEKDELHFEQLLDITGMEVNALNSLLTRMEIMSIIKKLPGNTYGI